MKYVVAGVMARLMLGAITVIAVVLKYDAKHKVVRCAIIHKDAPVYDGPGIHFEKVCSDAHGMVDVIGKQGDWWKLASGFYMPGYCLTPIRAGEYPRELPKKK